MSRTPRARSNAPRATRPRAGRIEIHPVTADRWDDLVRLFGPRGACAGCWCMWPRLARRDYIGRSGEANRRSLRARVQKGPPPGLIAYVDGEPAAWCAVAPRGEFVRIEQSRVVGPVDDQPAWAVPCFFVARGHRGRGLTVKLLREAVRWAAGRGARLVEGYPIATTRRGADVWLWHGAASTFERAGFGEVARRSRTRPIMRKRVAAAPRRA